MYIAVISATPDNRIGKFAPFDTEDEANAHVEQFGGFVAQDPGGGWPSWLVDMDAKTLTSVPLDPPEPEPSLADRLFTALKDKGVLSENDLSP